MKKVRGHGPLFVIIAFTFLLQLAYIWFSSLARLTAFSLVDDAFYYLNIARHVMAGHGVSFDGIHKTNGFQPLWELLILPLGWIQSKAVCLRVMCTLCAFLYNLVTVFLYSYLRAILNRRGALIGALLWSLNARLVFTYALNGMEFSLFALVILAFLDYDRRWVAGVERLSVATCLKLGLLWGLCTLARFDGVLVGVLAVAAIFWNGIRRKALKTAIQSSLVLAAGFVIVTAPYFIWNHWNFAHWLPVSGMIKQALTRQGLAARGMGFLSPRHLVTSLEQGGILWVKYLARFVTGYGYYLLRLLNLSQNAIAVLGLLVCGLLAAVAVGANGWRAVAAPWRKAWLGFLFVTLHFMTYALLLTPFIDYGNWYFGPLYLFFCLALAVILDALAARIHTWGVVLCGVFIAANLAAFLFFHDEPKINVMGARDGLAFVERNLKGERIGSWNAGCLGYFAENNTVINLDGLVGDYELAQYHTRGLPIREYLKKNRIRYLCDYQLRPEDIGTEFYGLKPGEIEILYRSPFYQPPFIDSRIYYVVRVK